MYDPNTRTDRLTWAEIRRLALRHKKSLWAANGVAVLATLCSVPIPLLLPLLVDEVLLGHGDAALKVMNHALPLVWQKAAGYIGLMLLVTLLLRCGALVFNVLQARLFARLAKDIVYRIRVRLIERLKRISLGEYESLGSGTVTTHLVTDLDTLDKFVGETLSRFLVAMLTLVGTSAILVWMHWQLALLILLFNPLVIYATVQLGKRVKHLKKLENDSTSRFTQALTETLDAIQEVRAGNRQGFFLGRLGQRAQEVRDYAIHSQWKTDASSRASGLLFQFGIDIFRAAAMLTVLFSDLSIGQMLAVFSYLWFMMTPVEQLLNLQYAYYAAGGALTRINELLARADEPQYAGGKNLRELANRIVLVRQGNVGHMQFRKKCVREMKFPQTVTYAVARPPVRSDEGSAASSLKRSTNASSRSARDPRPSALRASATCPARSAQIIPQAAVSRSTPSAA